MPSWASAQNCPYTYCTWFLFSAKGGRATRGASSAGREPRGRRESGAGRPRRDSLPGTAQAGFRVRIFIGPPMMGLMMKVFPIMMALAARLMPLEKGSKLWDTPMRNSCRAARSSIHQVNWMPLRRSQPVAAIPLQTGAPAHPRPERVQPPPYLHDSQGFATGRGAGSGWTARFRSMASSEREVSWPSGKRILSP